MIESLALKLVVWVRVEGEGGKGYRGSVIDKPHERLWATASMAARKELQGLLGKVCSHRHQTESRSSGP